MKTNNLKKSVSTKDLLSVEELMMVKGGKKGFENIQVNCNSKGSGVIMP